MVRFSILFLSSIMWLSCHAADEKLSLLLIASNAERGKAAASLLEKSRFEVAVSTDFSALNAEALTKTALIVFAGDETCVELTVEQESALLDGIESGRGFVAIGSSGAAFPKSTRYAALIGARVASRKSGSARNIIIDAQNAITRGIKGFETNDELVVHKQKLRDLRVLMARDENGGYEPVAWTRTQGKGRVFHTTLGQDAKTFNSPEFKTLVMQGAHWAAHKIDPADEAELEKPELQPVPDSGKSPEPLAPAESMKHMHLPEGYRVELFAAEPDVVRPICMAFDERGRLWVAETVDYPNDILGPGEGHDRIKICEDTDGDGKADKFTIFADKLNIPTALALVKDGVIVGCAPDILLIKDTNGDGKADERKVLLTGFGRRDTHAVVSNFRWSMDNSLWATVGYSGGEINGRHFGQSVFRIRLDGSGQNLAGNNGFELLTATSNNTWGLGFNSAGDAFISTANNQHAVFLSIPNRFYESVRGWSGKGNSGIEDHKLFHPVTGNVRQGDHFGAYTAAAGITPYTARSFPPEYSERAAFVCEPTGHLIHTDWLNPVMSSFVARDGYNLMASDDPWTAPIETQVGPDGALWFIDWYNYIIIHNNPYVKTKHGEGNAVETPMRDKMHGRIYRIVHDSAKPGETPQFDKAKPADLVKALSHENQWWRTTAQRLIVQGEIRETIPALLEVVEKGGPEAAAHALWTLKGLGAFDARTAVETQQQYLQRVKAALSHAAPIVRRAALDVLPRSAESVRTILTAGSLRDNDARVRLQALLAIAEMPPVGEAGPAILNAALDARTLADNWAREAAISAAARNDVSFLIAAAGAKPDAAMELLAAVRVVSEHFARGGPKDTLAMVLGAIANSDSKLAETFLNGLSAGWPAASIPEQKASLERDFAAMNDKLTPAGQSIIAKFAQRWQLGGKLAEKADEARKKLFTQVSDNDMSDAERIIAARQLISIGADDESLKKMLELANPKAGLAFSNGIIDELSRSNSDIVGPALLERWATLTPNARRAGITALLRRDNWTKLLLDAIESGKIEPAELSHEHTQLLLQQPDAAIATRAKDLLSKKGRLPDADRQKVVEQLLPIAQKPGNVARGKAVFEANCAKCHHFNEIGNFIGPELTGLGAREKADILVDILDPNRSVEGNFRVYTVKTTEGQLYSGILKNETQTSLELLDSEAKSHVIQRDKIQKLISSPQSLMPEGFEKLPEEDLASLLEYLTAKGQFFPLRIDKAATAVSTKRMFVGQGDEERLIFPNWALVKFNSVPFSLINPRDNSVPNAILLYSPKGDVCKTMPKSVSVPCNTEAAAIHLLSGIAGWGFPATPKGTLTMTVRLNYADGQSEDFALLNGVHFADYIRQVDVPESKFAFDLRGRQMRYLALKPTRTNVVIKSIDFVKGDDGCAPVVMAVTIERPANDNK